MTWKIIVLIWKAFQNTEKWHCSFWNIFFVLEILKFFCYANEITVDVILFASETTKQYKKYLINDTLHFWKYWSSVLENWHHKCVSQKEQNDTPSAAAIAIPSAPISFCQKTKYPHLQPLKGHKGSYLEQIVFFTS